MFMKALGCDPAFTAAFFCVDVCALVLVAAVDNLSASAPQHCWCQQCYVQKWLCSALVFFTQSPTQLSTIYVEAMSLVSQNNKNASICLCLSSCKWIRKMCTFLHFQCVLFVCLHLIGKKNSKYVISPQCFSQHNLCLLATILLIFFTQSFNAEIKFSPKSISSVLPQRCLKLTFWLIFCRLDVDRKARPRPLPSLSGSASTLEAREQRKNCCSSGVCLELLQKFFLTCFLWPFQYQSL